MRIANNIIINKVALEARTSAQQGEYIIPMLRKLPDNDTKSYAIACEAEEAFPTPRISKTTCTRAEWKEIWRNQRNKLTLAQAMQERPRLRNGRYNPVQITISGASSVDFTLESGHKIDLSAPAHV